VGEGGASRSEATGEGSASADRDPSSGVDCVHATFSHKGRRKKKFSTFSHTRRKHHMDSKVRDSNGALLAEGSLRGGSMTTTNSTFRSSQIPRIIRIAHKGRSARLTD